jgi:hypothetical protein
MEQSKGLQSGELEGQISFDQWFFYAVSLGDFSCVGAQSFFAHLQKVWYSAGIFCS